MDKKTRLKLIRQAYQKNRKHKRRLTPKSWQLIKQLREEADEVEPDVVVDFNQEDIREEIELMSHFRRFQDTESDWDNSHYYDSNAAAEMLYFRTPHE